MGAKAVVVYNSNNEPVQNAIAVLGVHYDTPCPLTNTDGYAVFPFNTDVVSTYVVVIADGYKSYIQPVTLSGENQDICVGSPASGNDIQLPPLSFSNPFRVMRPFWKGNMGGVHFDYLPPISGGAPDQTLFLSWFYDRYPVDIRQRIRTDLKGLGITHIQLSWIDSYDFGHSASEALNIYMECQNDGLDCTVFLGAKDSGMDHNVQAAVAFSMQFLNIAVGKIPAFCMGWEMSLWLTTEEIWNLCQQLCPVCLTKSGTLTYIHLQEGYFSFPLPDHDNASFWWPLQGLVYGILLQRRLDSTDEAFTSWIDDCLSRCSGEWNMPSSNGIDGQPIMMVADELNVMDQYWNGAPTSSGNHLGTIAQRSWASRQTGITVHTMGSGNGLEDYGISG